MVSNRLLHARLRSFWNPDLISKEVRLLDNTLSMYCLVNVCVFCTQYFDPDYPDGIAYPQRESLKVTCVFTWRLSTADPQRHYRVPLMGPLEQFFPDKMRSKWTCSTIADTVVILKMHHFPPGLWKLGLEHGEPRKSFRCKQANIRNLTQFINNKLYLTLTLTLVILGTNNTQPHFFPPI